MRERAWVRLRMEGLGAEKLLNGLWKEGVPVHDVKRSRKRGVELAADEKDARVAAAMAEAKGFRVTVLKEGIRQKIKAWMVLHAGLVAGLALGAVLAAVSMGYVWQVEITQAGRYVGEVRLFLEEKGIQPGIRQEKVDLKGLQEGLMWRLPEVKWVWVKRDGVKLTVKLEEGIAAREEGREPGDVVAAEDGILQRLTVFSGTAACRPGETVARGQVLIRGEETDKDGQVLKVRAKGEAVARVVVRKAVRLRTEELVTTPSGRVAERLLFTTPFGTYTFTEEPDFLMADREYIPSPLPGVWFPISVVRERFFECSGEWRERDGEEVAREGRKAAEEALIRAWPEAADIDKSYKISMIERGIVEVEAWAETERDIALYRSNP